MRLWLDDIVSGYGIHLAIANGENAAGGIGLTGEVAEEIFGYGINVLTMGNHVWDKKEIMEIIDEEERLLRPLNYPAPAPGRGSVIVPAGGVKVAVMNLSGRVFNPQHLDCPFRLADAELERLKAETPLVIVDFHAEATSEKQAMAWHLAGRVTALIGTHTHVQTSDEQVLPGGTAFITDVGMTGPTNSVIGIKKELALERFITQRPVKFEVARGRIQLSALVVEADEATGQARAVHRLLLRS